MCKEICATILWCNEKSVTYESVAFYVAWGFGDPHYDNMDRMNYTFNGCGEYMFLDTDNSAIQIQVKFTQATGAGLGTVISAIVLKYAGVSPIQINLILGGMYQKTWLLDCMSKPCIAQLI